MTREEAIECNKNLRMYMELSDKNNPYKFIEDNYIALDMAIKALEQQPCEDAISRESAMLRVREFIRNPTYTEKMFVDDLNALPPVTPQPKTGRWIHKKNALSEDITVCSECGKQMRQGEIRFCGACGAKMEVKE